MMQERDMGMFKGLRENNGAHDGMYSTGACSANCLYFPRSVINCFISFCVIMPPEHMPVASWYFINPSNQSMCLYVSLLGKGLVNTFPQQRIHETKKNCWTHRLTCGPCCIKEVPVGLSAYPLNANYIWRRYY
jgi:hypothetical protein